MVATILTKPMARRAASQPIQRTASGSDSQIETLFNHPSARVISFTTSSQPTSRLGSSSGSSRVEEAPGTLPWVSRSERTIAVGAFNYHNAPLLLTTLIVNARPIEHISSTRLCSILELLACTTTHIAEVAMLGSRRIWQIRPTDPATSILAH
jgi:Inheritance of peroxisomes protein 1